MELFPTLWIKAPFNAGAFAFRQWLGWRRGLPKLKGERWPSAIPHWPTSKQEQLVQKAEQLYETFSLAPFDKTLSSRQWVKNLYWLDLLGTTLAPHLQASLTQPSGPQRPTRTLDVGCADWDYVFALQRFFRNSFTNNMELTGLEIDGHGIYPDGYARADYTAAYIHALKDPAVSIRYGDATRMKLPPQDVVTCLFPFILPYQILAWGLPLHLLKPQALLQAQAGWIRPGGLWYLVCHAIEEREPMRKQLAALKECELLTEGPARSDFEDDPDSYDERWFWLLRKR
jgi:hypothetical protein